jgi:flagellar FliL protein
MSAPDSTPAAGAPASPAGKSVPLALILAVVLGLAAGAGAGLFAVGPALADGIAPAVAATAKHGKKAKPKADAEHGEAADDEAAADGEEGDEAEEEAGGDHGAKGKEGAAATVYTLDNLVLNPAESGGTRFLLLSIAFETKTQAAHDQMKARDAELRDLVLATVGNKTVDQLADLAVRDSLKTELRAAAAKLLRKKAVKRVYFPQFVIQ